MSWESGSRRHRKLKLMPCPWAGACFRGTSPNFLFNTEDMLLAATGVDHDAERQRQVGFALKYLMV